MNNGCTVVVTLTKHRGPGPPDDEQLHVLPLYRLDDSPLEEQGQTLGELDQRKRSGALQVLTKSVFKFFCQILKEFICIFYAILMRTNKFITHL